jgi:predicted DNA-binding transcriptional regulator YafY
MPINRNALIRYRTIDNCLKNRFRKWTLEDLIDACSDTLYEYEGIDKGVSVRTVQMDIQMMRSDKLGYNAPIIVVDKKYYTYEDPKYSITNIPLTEKDMGTLSEVIDILKQFKGFGHFQEMTEMVSKLEDRVYAQKHKQSAVIDFEKNEYLAGLEFLDVLYQAIIKKQVLGIDYQSFRSRQPVWHYFNPWLLKEYRNRWFLVGSKGENSPILTLALDRMKGINILEEEVYYQDSDFDPQKYYRDIVGVTVNQGERLEEIIILANHLSAPYILTKPLHHSQTLLKKDKDGYHISVKVKVNYEFERDILGFGETIKILSPKFLAERIQKKLKKAVQLYES